MPHYTEYRCGVCKQVTLRQLLVVKKVVFTEIGPGAKIIKSRTVGWICNECVENDTDFQLEKYSKAPGHKSAPLERVRAATADQITSLLASSQQRNNR